MLCVELYPAAGECDPISMCSFDVIHSYSSTSFCQCKEVKQQSEGETENTKQFIISRYRLQNHEWHILLNEFSTTIS